MATATPAGIVSTSGNHEFYGLNPTTRRVVVEPPSVGEIHLAPAPSAGEGVILIRVSGTVEAFDGPKGWLG